MTYEDRGREPTSYDLQPPVAPGRPAGGPGAVGDRHDAPTRTVSGHPEPSGPPTAPGRPAPSGRPPRPAPPTGHADPGQRPAGPDGERVVGGRYRLVSRLGHGGMGTVWLAHDEVVGRDVAVKEPRLPDHLTEAERQTAYQRMRREARAAAGIDHPSVVTVHDVVVEDGRPWIVMELVRGRSLADVLSEGTVEPKEAARVGLAVLGALASAHEAGVLHRDVKPDNVLLGQHGRVVLTDFGIAQVEGERKLTETGAFVGSPEYIAPERVLGRRAGPESDLWSLGVVLYAAVEGMSPFRRSTAPATLQAVLSAEPQVPARASGALGALIMRLLRKDPAARPDAGEVRQDLESVARPHRPSAAARAPGGGRLRGVGRALRTSRSAQAGTGGAVAVVLAVVLALLWPVDDGLPDGWRTYDETRLVGASLAAPSDYTRSVNDNRVTLTSPDKTFVVWIQRERDNWASPLGEANEQLEFYRDKPYDSDMEEVEGRVVEKEYRGRPRAAELSVTYRPRNDEEAARLRRREFHYVSPEAVSWRLVVQMPAAGQSGRTGEEMYERIVAHLELDRGE
ncbi:protein kinase [Streptomyces sp. TRM43335]|uniref:non-specific serine/threonine protein kinase n=1 Tax=Streptomyces taklimakanensis TaxID=2569853 RepID=A0A6G2BEB6_9ACTN|nr:serine/threonine-protein kinase [Streptomyces taklimakanensis]MTE20621.1 protein kinase [Streptomyces taklimakanensis]